MRQESKQFKEPLSDRIVNKPTLFFGNALFLNAWFDLDTERERPNRITRKMCFEYAYFYDFDIEQTEDLWYHIRQMDSEFLPWWKKRQPKLRTGKGRKGGPGPQEPS